MSLPFERVLVIDAETAWSKKEYTLSKMTTEEYVRDPRFKAWGLCAKVLGNEMPPVWVRGIEIESWVKHIDWSKTAVLAHNAQFDVTILSWRYGVQPAFIFDTLSMARALRGIEAGNSLAKLAEGFGLPPKGQAVHSTDGILDELPTEVEVELAEYCKHDVMLCEAIFDRLLPGFPAKELRLIDLTLKMYTRPLLELDKDMLRKAIEEERQTREELLQRLGVEEATLASNEKFAAALAALGVQAPTKISKTTGKETLALAKNDALFQALLNSESEDVALLCEARLRVKSTSERTRAQRFLDIANRGRLPVPLSYFGAGTGRYTASKGSAINMQNLKRDSFLRKAIMAPEGHVLVVGDLSQIEPRVLSVLADNDPLLDIFRAGGDPYAAFGAQMFGIPGLTKDSHPVERQSAKSALLGCFGSQTPVLTQRGWVIIQDVLPEDQLWDGVGWVTHQGVVPQGEKEVLTAHGISATSDHEILTEHGWVEWSAVLANHSLFQSARSLANSLAWSGADEKRVLSGGAALCTNPTCDAPVGGKALLPAPTFVKDVQHAVTPAPKRSPLLHAWRKQGLQRYAQTTGTATGSLTASAPSLLGALTQTVQRIQTTVDVASQYILNGCKTASSFCATSLASMGGISPHYSLIASTTTGAMFPGTFGSSLEARTCQTSGASLQGKSRPSSNASAYLKQRMQTYDIAYAGPRNRYTILTDDGPLVVHNCGYQLGWASFASQLLTGFLGAKPLRYTKEDAKTLGVTGKDVQRFLEWEENVKKLEAIPHTCTDIELAIHCLAAKAIIDKFRAASTPVVTFWNMCQELIEYSLYRGKEYTHKCIEFRKEQIILPSGMAMRYPDLKPERVEGKTVWTYADGNKRVSLYGGKVTNNIVQGTARCVMTDGMLRVAKKYPLVGTVHDELIAVVPEEEAEDAKTWVLAQMTAPVPYLPGIPLNSDVGYNQRYGLA